MQINPKEIVERGIVKMSEFSLIQQVGIDLSLSEEVFLNKGDSINILLNETIALPIDMYATFHQRSSYSRKGVFVTTGIYDPGYEGSLGCTIYNLGNKEILIPKNERIGQVLCFKADAASRYNGQYMGK